ncbi:PadR family transcriptional regulator [Vibrio algicola]|uniref:PadR family transcriptional regulator n=1 Tax=Vibrio algicola TaxID=2662262 RepID=A0A5Q0TBE5_9VIBR|nr:PadR family transcriptional regulator [Vibrio algicola]
MSLPHVILTILSQKEATGYDITKAFSQQAGQYWKASHQQVYRELSKMLAKEWVTCEELLQVGKPDKKVYAITPYGSKALEMWFELPMSHTELRDEFSAKLMACTVQSPQPLIEQLERLIPENEALLLHYQQLDARYSLQSTLSASLRLERLTVRRNLIERQSWLTWAIDVKQELESILTKRLA